MHTFLHSQQRTSTCAVASVRTVLHKQFGARIAEAALVALGQEAHDPILAEGADTKAIRRMVREASRSFNTSGVPWTLRVRKQGTLRQLANWIDEGRWPIVQVFVQENLQHHAIVVVKVERDRVQYFDPDPSEGLRWMNRERFLEWWLCPITSERWWAVVNGGELVERNSRLRGV